MFRCCQRFVLMLECETFCALSLRLPVMSLRAMTGRGNWSIDAVLSSRQRNCRFSEPFDELGRKPLHRAKTPAFHERGLVHVEAAGHLDLHGVHAAIRSTPVARRETASIRLVVLHAEARFFGVPLDEID